VNYDGARFLGSGSVQYADKAFWSDVLSSPYHGYSDAYTLVNGQVFMDAGLLPKLCHECFLKIDRLPIRLFRFLALAHGEQHGAVRPLLIAQLVAHGPELPVGPVVGAGQRPISHTASRVATSIGPSNTRAACSSETPGSSAGVRCVSTNRRTSARTAISAACSALRWKKV